MSTRSIIGTAHDSGFEGRYCHWDGQPPTRGVQLQETYRQFKGDVRKVKDWAIREGQVGYWSSYGPPSEAAVGWRSDNGDSWATDREDCGAEWAYLLDERGFAVVENTTRGWNHIATVGWADTDTDWTAIECGPDWERCPHYAWRHFPEANDTRVGIATWLGRKGPGHSDLTALIEKRTGQRLRLTGSGGTSDASGPRNWFTDAKVRYWWVSVDGRPDVRAFRLTKGGYKLESRYDAVAPTAAGEVLVTAGTVLR